MRDDASVTEGGCLCGPSNSLCGCGCGWLPVSVRVGVSVVEVAAWVPEGVGVGVGVTSYPCEGEWVAAVAAYNKPSAGQGLASWNILRHNRNTWFLVVQTDMALSQRDNSGREWVGVAGSSTWAVDRLTNDAWTIFMMMWVLQYS